MKVRYIVEKLSLIIVTEIILISSESFGTLIKMWFFYGYCEGLLIEKQDPSLWYDTLQFACVCEQASGLIYQLIFILQLLNS
jgi:hypothetical protein